MHCRLYKLSAFTLVELIATIAVVAMLAVALVVFIGGYIADAKRTADRQTLAVLNDALTRYKTQGGRLAALTSGASIGNVLTELQTPVTWAGIRHQFLKTSTTYTAASIGAIGEGQRYRFTKYGSFADGSAVGSDILETVAATGYDVGDEAAFDEWITQAMAETGTTNYLALTNPDTTDRFGIYARVANSGDKVRVWWGDGTTQNYDSISTSSNTVIAKNFGSSAARTIVIVGDLSYLHSAGEEILGGASATAFGGDVGTMSTLIYLYCWGTNTLQGNIGKMSNLTFINVVGNNSLSGDISNLKSLTTLVCYGTNTLTGGISGLTNLTYVDMAGSNSISGLINPITGTTVLRLIGNNTVTGTLSSNSLLFLHLGGSSSIDVDSLVNVSGTSTGLTVFNLREGYTLTQTQVDAILTNFWANKDATKPRSSERVISINQPSHAAPSSTGLTAKANLESYMSPNNTGPMVWTVYTR